MSWIATFLLIISCPSYVESQAGQDSDEDFLMWKTVNEKSGLISVYENVDLQASSFLAVCLGRQFNRNMSNDGNILLETSHANKVFEWKSHFNSEVPKSYSRIQCLDDAGTCYTTEESKCSDTYNTDLQYLSFGHCQEDMSMIISSDSFKISCGDQVVEANRCPEGKTTEPEMFKITVKEFSDGVCATRVRPIQSGWIDVLSGDSINRTIDFAKQSLLINQLLIRELHPDKTTFTLSFDTLGSENKIKQTDAIVIKLNSSGPYIYKTSVTITAYTVCSSSASKEFSVGKELGKTQIEITLVGEQIAIMVGNSSDEGVMIRDTIWLPFCNEIEDQELMMNFEDSTAKRNISLISNTNIKIVEKGKCLDPNIAEHSLRIVDQDQNETTYIIGSEVQLECEDPRYKIEGSNTITCQLDKTWTPQDLPVCIRRTCEDSEFLDNDGTCKSCTETEARCKVCNVTIFYDSGLVLEEGAKSTYIIGSEIEVACADPMNEIKGSALMTCDSTKVWLPETFPSCTRKTCPYLQDLAEDGKCYNCTEESWQCGYCTEPSLNDPELKLDDRSSLSSYSLGSKITLVCVDPKHEVDVARSTLTCQSDNRWIPSDLPSCNEKQCDKGKSLNDEGQCVYNCPKGQYAEEGTSGECRYCKSRGDKFYSDTIGSADCKICDGEVDSGRTICLQRDPNSQPPESNGGGNTKQIIYICMGVVAFVAHLTAFGITKFRNNLSSSSAQNRGSKSEYFFWRVKKYDSTKISQRKFSNRNPETSCTLDRQTMGKEQTTGAESCKIDLGNSQPCSSEENNEVNDLEATFIGIADTPFSTQEAEESAYEDVSLMPLPSNKVSGHESSKEGQISAYEDVSLMPLPTTMKDERPLSTKEVEPSEYEDVTLMPLPTNKIPSITSPSNVATTSKVVPPISLPPPPILDAIKTLSSSSESLKSMKYNEIEVGAKENRSASQSKMHSPKDVETLKNDVTDKKVLTGCEKETKARVENRKKRDETDKADVTTSENPSTSKVNNLDLEKEFAEIDDLLQFDGWTVKTGNGNTSTSKNDSPVESGTTPGIIEPSRPSKPSKPTFKPTSKLSRTPKAEKEKSEMNQDEEELSFSYSEDAYAVMEYTGEPIQLYETMSLSGTLKTYNHISALSKKDADGVERYVPLGADTEEEAVYTRSTKQIRRRTDEENVAEG